MVFVPIAYGVMGFVMTVILAALYNGLAKLVGGVEIDVTLSGSARSTSPRPRPRPPPERGRRPPPVAPVRAGAPGTSGPRRLDDVQADRGAERSQDRGQLLGRAEAVAGALHEQHRLADCAPGARPGASAAARAGGADSRGRRRPAEPVEAGRGHVGGHAPAHRLAADHQTARPQSGRARTAVDHRAEAASSIGARSGMRRRSSM